MLAAAGWKSWAAGSVGKWRQECSKYTVVLIDEKRIRMKEVQIR